MNILLFIGSYLLGAVPFGLLIGKMVGADVRTAGSRNIGATNVSRVLGRKLGVLTLVCDVLKGFMPVLMASWLLPDSDNKELFLVLCGLLAVLGHMFPVYLGFKGGKGVATGLGVFLFLSGWSIVLAAVVFVGAVMLSGFVSVGSLGASVVLPLGLALLGEPLSVIGGGGVLAVLIWLKHHENIGRLLKGQEKSWKKKP